MDLGLYGWLTLILLAAGAGLVVAARLVRGPRKGLFRSLGYIAFTMAALTAFLALILG